VYVNYCINCLYWRALFCCFLQQWSRKWFFQSNYK